MDFAQWLSFKIDDTIKMLMDNHTSKIEVALYLMRFKNDIIDGGKKDIVDGEFEEVEVRGIEERGLIE